MHHLVEIYAAAYDLLQKLERNAAGQSSCGLEGRRCMLLDFLNWRNLKKINLCVSYGEAVCQWHGFATFGTLMISLFGSISGVVLALGVAWRESFQQSVAAVLLYLRCCRYFLYFL